MPLKVSNLRYTTWHFSFFSEFEAGRQGCERVIIFGDRQKVSSYELPRDLRELLAQAPQALAEQAW